MDNSRNTCTNSGAGVVIFLASLVLVAMTVKAEETTPKFEETKLIWTSDCPKYEGTSNTNLCKKKIYVDDSVKLDKDIKWNDVEEIAKIAYDWKYQFKQKFKSK